MQRTMVIHVPIKNRSLITGRGGGVVTKQEGGGKVLPLQRMSKKRFLAMRKGGHKSF